MPQGFSSPREQIGFFGVQCRMQIVEHQYGPCRCGSLYGELARFILRMLGLRPKQKDANNNQLAVVGPADKFGGHMGKLYSHFALLIVHTSIQHSSSERHLQTPEACDILTCTVFHRMCTPEDTNMTASKPCINRPWSCILEEVCWCELHVLCCHSIFKSARCEFTFWCCCWRITQSLIEHDQRGKSIFFQFSKALSV